MSDAVRLEAKISTLCLLMGGLDEGDVDVVDAVVMALIRRRDDRWAAACDTPSAPDADGRFDSGMLDASPVPSGAVALAPELSHRDAARGPEGGAFDLGGES